MARITSNCGQVLTPPPGGFAGAVQAVPRPGPADPPNTERPHRPLQVWRRAGGRGPPASSAALSADLFTASSTAFPLTFLLPFHCLPTTFPRPSTAFPRPSTAFSLPFPSDFHRLSTAFPLPFHCLSTTFPLPLSSTFPLLSLGFSPSFHCLQVTIDSRAAWMQVRFRVAPGNLRTLARAKP